MVRRDEEFSMRVVRREGQLRVSAILTQAASPVKMLRSFRGISSCGIATSVNAYEPSEPTSNTPLALTTAWFEVDEFD